MGRTSFGQRHDLVKHHQEIFHAQYHVDAEKRQNQRKGQGSELIPPGGSVNRSGLVHVLRNRLDARYVDDGIHCNRLPGAHRHDGHPGPFGACQHAGSRAAHHFGDSGKDIGKKVVKNIAHHQCPQNVGNKVKPPQPAFKFNLTVKPSARIRLSTLTTTVETTASLMVKR